MAYTSETCGEGSEPNEQGRVPGSPPMRVLGFTLHASRFTRGPIIRNQLVTIRRPKRPHPEAMFLMYYKHTSKEERGVCPLSREKPAGLGLRLVATGLTKQTLSRYVRCLYSRIGTLWEWP